jgi:hypothetical protein
MEDRVRRPVIHRRGVLGAGLASGLAWAAPALAHGSSTTIKASDGRSVKVSIWPAAGSQKGVILFSHGALSAPEQYARLLGPWSMAGFKILAPLHVDSTEHPDNVPHAKAMDSWRCRILDMQALCDFAAAPGYIAAGHSYGALTALTLGGAEGVRPVGVTGPFIEPLAKAVVAFSPPGPIPALMTREGYGHLGVPALIETGTADTPPGVMGGGDFHAHLAAYDAAPPGDKYALVLDGVDHYFGGLLCKADVPGPPQTAGLANAVAVSTAFLQAYGSGDAKAWTALSTAPTTSSGFTLHRK